VSAGKPPNWQSFLLVKNNFFRNRQEAKFVKHYQVIEILKNGIEILMSRRMYDIQTSVYLFSPEHPN